VERLTEESAAETRLAAAAAHLGPTPEQAEAAPVVDLAVAGMGDEVAVASRSVARSWSGTCHGAVGAHKGQTALGLFPAPRIKDCRLAACVARAATARHHPLYMAIRAAVRQLIDECERIERSGRRCRSVR